MVREGCKQNWVRRNDEFEGMVELKSDYHNAKHLKLQIALCSCPSVFWNAGIGHDLELVHNIENTNNTSFTFSDWCIFRVSCRRIANVSIRCRRTFCKDTIKSIQNFWNNINKPFMAKLQAEYEISISYLVHSIEDFLQNRPIIVLVVQQSIHRVSAGYGNDMQKVV